MRSYMKILSLLLVVLLSVSVTSGCNKPDVTDTESNISDNESEVVSETTSVDETTSKSEEEGNSEVAESVDVSERDEAKSEASKSTSTSTGNSSQSSPGALEEVDKYKSDNLPNVDLKKFIFKVGTSDKSLIKYLYSGNEAKEHPISQNQKLRYEALAAIEKRFNCIIEPIFHEYAKTSEVYSSSILSGASASVPHVILTSTWEAGNMMAGNLLIDYGQVDYIDASKPWWNTSLANASKIKGKTYLMSSEFGRPSNRAWMVGYNKKIAKEIGLTESILKTLIENKQWNWSKFIEYSKKAVKDVNGDSKLDEKDRWGFSAPRTDFTYAMMASAGIGFIELQNGKMTYALNNERAISALEQINQIITTENIRFPVENNVTQMEAFGKKNTLFGFYQSNGIINDIREHGDMGLLPMPIGPGMKEYVSLIDHNSPVIMIPKTNKKLKETGLLLEALAFADWKLLPDMVENYEDLYFDEGDNLSPKIFRDNFNYLTVAATQFNNTTNYGRGVLQPVLNAVATPNEDISGVVASIRNSGQALIDQFFGQ